jgi:hypothetical protein
VCQGITDNQVGCEIGRYWEKTNQGQPKKVGSSEHFYKSANVAEKHVVIDPPN